MEVRNEETNDGYWIAINSLMPRIIKLDAKPAYGSTVDTDDDLLYDIEELWSIEPSGYHQTTIFTQYLLPSVSFSPTVIPLYMYYSNPSEIDTDEDDINDYEEYIFGTLPLFEDSDNDKLTDGKELDMWFDPLNKNYDGDSYNDYQEWKNGTSPFVYNMNSKESRAAFLKGGLFGDFVTADSIEMLLGQIVFSFTPFVADARDFIANIIVNFDGWAALANVGGFALDFTGVLGATANASKAVSKLGEFVIRYADDAPKVVEAIVQGSKHFPDSGEVIPMLAKIIPVGAFDDITQSLKNGKKISKADYTKLQEIFKASEKSFDIGNSLKPQKLLDELIESGNKFNLDEVIAITKMPDGKLVWLEIGKETGGVGSAGLLHIERHLSQFEAKGINKEELPDFIMAALSKGKKVGIKNTRDIYKVVYKGKTQRVAIQIGSNGFIVGANPKSIP